MWTLLLRKTLMHFLSSIFRWMVDTVFIVLASCSLTLAHLLLPYDWPVWHHVTKHHTAIFGVRSRRTEHFQNAHRRACWCQLLWHPSLFCHGIRNTTHTWICWLINWLFVVTDASSDQSSKCYESKDKWKKNLLTWWPHTCLGPFSHSS